MKSQQPSRTETTMPKKRFFKFKTSGEKTKTIRIIDDDDEKDSDDEDSDVEIDMVNVKDIRCYNCRRMGHFASDWQGYGKPPGLEGKGSKGKGQGRHLATLEKPLPLARVSRV